MKIVAFLEDAGGAGAPPWALPNGVSSPATARERDALAEAARRLRSRVFVDEQGVSRELEFDGLDRAALHLVASDADAVVGVLRLLTDGDRVRLGRMAVDRARRGAGIGAALARAAVDCARRQGASEVVLHAQTQALGFYAGLGFAQEGDPFDEAGIPHVVMRRVLTAAGDPD